ncbi:hypothetical protein B9G69_016130 [Bdellovibrio sp. SKB1291214]|uniref:hypothetical protein n=1 Tax=Bdellovibrio sp. SKB1291214 TaxID=1732569 RepID=UPI000B5189F2|nr:hypothetical protein [Bdellovibrio sp. SKB1291214]UYL08573.1 hypothetical protein B9G69_016130 [Bdellovibrio sp. SKB1291214]
MKKIFWLVALTIIGLIFRNYISPTAATQTSEQTVSEKPVFDKTTEGLLKKSDPLPDLPKDHTADLDTAKPHQKMEDERSQQKIFSPEELWFAKLKGAEDESNVSDVLARQLKNFPQYFVTLNKMKLHEHLYVQIEQNSNLEEAMGAVGTNEIYIQRGQYSKDLGNIKMDSNYCRVRIDGQNPAPKNSGHLYLEKDAETTIHPNKTVEVRVSNALTSTRSLRRIKEISCFKPPGENKKKEFNFIELLFHLQVDGDYTSSGLLQSS